MDKVKTPTLSETVEQERLLFARNYSIAELYAVRQARSLKPYTRLALEREIARRERLDKRFARIDADWDKAQ